MTEQNDPYPKHEKFQISTSGELDNWLNTEAVGDSPRAESYLHHLRMLRDEAKEEGRPELNQVLGIIGGEIARAAEQRLADTAKSTGGHLPEEIPGITPPHTVTEGDISNATALFDPTSPNFNDKYTDALSVITVHSVIREDAEAEIYKAEHPEEFDDPNDPN